MKRHASFEPPEYVAWASDATERSRFDATIARHPERAAIIGALREPQLLDLYAGLVRTRLIDVALKRFVKQGVISKAWLGTGEEAATVGPVHALRRGPNGDIVAPMIRNSGACNEMGMPAADIFRSYMGTGDSPSHGRDGHYGDFSRGILPPVSIVGDCAAVVAGIALAMRLQGRDSVALTWVGDGSTKTGVFHEGLNFAAVNKVPAIFVIQNNQVALGTRLSQHHLEPAPTSFANWPQAYGIWGGVFDGNNVLDGYALTSLAAERCRRGEGPALLIAETFRMGGHATHDEHEARRTFDSELFGLWGRREPIAMYEQWLRARGISAEQIEAREQDVELEVSKAEEEALASRASNMPKGEDALSGVYHTGMSS
jgi:pyruvate dehydrogenase E1 component alpha subunit/2-oxoisovalerate dehydrogenase E1 component alpha subunit